MTDHAEALAKALEDIATARTEHANRGDYERGWNDARFRMKDIADRALAAYRSRPAAEVVVKQKAESIVDHLWLDTHEKRKAVKLIVDAFATPAPVAGTEPAGEVVEPRADLIDAAHWIKNAMANKTFPPSVIERGRKAIADLTALAALRDQSEA